MTTVQYAPLEPQMCTSCNEVLVDGCPKVHEHRAWECYGVSDMRQLDCGCYVHKECQKSGEGCGAHGTTAP